MDTNLQRFASKQDIACTNVVQCWKWKSWRWNTPCKMQRNNKFREQIRLFRRGGGGPVLAEFEQAIGGKKLFVVRDVEKVLVVCGEQGNVLEGFEHLFDRIGKECTFLLDPPPSCLVEKFAKCSISRKNIGCKAFVFPTKCNKQRYSFQGM